MFIFKVHLSKKLEFLYQKSCLVQNVEKKDKIYDKQLLFLDRDHEEIHKFMFIFLLINYVQILYVDVVVDQTGNEMYIYFCKCLPEKFFFVLFIYF